FYDSSLSLFREIGFKKGEAAVLNYIGIVYQEMGDFQKAIDYTLKGVEVRKTTDDYSGTVFSLINTGNMFLNGGQADLAMKYYKESIVYAQQHHMEAFPYSLDQVGNTFMRLKQYDSAKIYLFRTASNSSLLKGQFFYETGIIDSAAKQFETTLTASQRSGDYRQIAASLNWMSKIYLQKKQPALAMQYATKAFVIADSAQIKVLKSEAAETLSQLYENSGNYKSALYYFKLAHSILDSVANGNYQNKLAYFESKTEIEKGQNDIKVLSAQKALQQQKLKQEKLYKNSILIATLIIILAAFFIIRNINGKKKRIQLQKDQIDYQKKQVEVSFEELKSTQAQLIQREKMASLGELTAGIAHEIQNPLNFVNNFSEVNTELIDELEELANNGNIEEIKAIAKDIRENEEKINHHGKRADAIVKGMLQHSRSSTGVKEPTDINALSDEYLRLAYHGLRAKDKNLNAKIKTDFDESIGKINIISQDIGRVLLNLYNNAFYATNEKKQQAGNSYQPIIAVSTKKIHDKIEIKVSDNGNGIPQPLIDKIFQPFFTTKPAGQGTGLGLSLSYDIIKAHGGEIKVESNETEGSQFIIILPANS
ncbi:MAG: ATP-binding protein, partial [Ginsengibacter sp.]